MGKKKEKTTRRSFLTQTGILTAGLSLGVKFRGAST